MQRFIERLEDRRHFAVSWTLLPDNVKTLFLYSDGAGDTINVAVRPDPEPGYQGWYYYLVSDGAGTFFPTFWAKDLWVYGYGGGDTIEVDGARSGRVTGGAGSDVVKLIDCSRVRVSDLSPSEREDLSVDLADTFKFDGATFCEVFGGAGDDVFRMGGDMSASRLYGGAGADTFNGGTSTFVDGWIEGFAGDPWFDVDGKTTVNSRGYWDFATIIGGPVGDSIDCRSVSGSVGIFGEGGNDTLQGGSGNDYLHGGPGRDELWGGPGGDTLQARDGESDTLSGGAGYDKAYADEIDLFWTDASNQRDIEDLLPDEIFG